MAKVKQLALCFLLLTVPLAAFADNWTNPRPI